MKLKFYNPPLWFKVFLLISMVGLMVAGVVYGAVQHSIRMAANSPQIQIAEDLSTALENGASPSNILGTSRIDISQSLAPFVIIYNTKGEVVASSGMLNGKFPSVPSGVLRFTSDHGEDRLTWQPQANTRIAAVVKAYKNGYVLAGRNLREVERTEMETEQIAGAALIALVIGGFILSMLLFGDLKSKR